ncbi:MAG: polyphenol oxidase, partial [Prevotella sp.]
VFNAFKEKGFSDDKQCVSSSAQLLSINNNNVLVDNSAKDNEPKWHIDLAQCNKKQLESLGVPAQNINLSGICTYSNHHEYFSARRLGTASGRIYTGILLRG